MKMRFFTVMICACLALLAGCTDLVTIAVDPVPDDSAWLPAADHGVAAAHTSQFERALALAAHRER